ncbi:hypothetical protein Hanom_Chr02g00175501 [Helianthus anomalus]
MSKLPFWSLWFGYFFHFNPKVKLFASGSMWFQFYCHFGPKINQVVFVYKIMLFCPFPQRQNDHFFFINKYHILYDKYDLICPWENDKIA